MSNSLVRNSKVVRIDSKQLNRMLELGGESLVAIYAELKAFRNSEERYKPIKHNSNNKVSTGYSLLTKCTGISKTTLKKYVPMLIELGLVYFDSSNGALHINGYKKIVLSKSKKLVPILIRSSFSETRASVQFILLNSNRDAQIKAAVKKQTLKDKFKLSLSPKGILTKKDYEKICNLRKKGITKPSQLKVVKDVILSNQGFASILTQGSTSKSNGHYYKKKFTKLGLIETRRRFKDVLGRQISFEEYLGWRYSAKQGGINVDRITWRKGRAVEELVSSISIVGKTNDFTPITYIKKSINSIEGITPDTGVVI
jgi:ssDNA-specific exonuclease RecJ